MKISPEKLAAEAEETGFRPDVLEKVAQLTSDTSLQKLIHSQPLLQWKALNVKRHKGLA